VRHIRPLVIILLALAIGALAVVVALKWLGQRSKADTIQVVVASRDLPFGTQLQPNMLNVIDWPVSSQLKEPFAATVQIDQRVINTPIMRGEPILASKLAPLGEKGGLSALLHEGTRAVTVKVNEIVGVAGFALPGNYVDVMVHATGKNEQPVSKIVLERILVLALAQDASTSETKPRVVNAVTLEVTPQQAEKIDFARSVGALTLVLRSQIEKESVQTAGVRMVDLFPTTDAVPLVKPIAAKTVSPKRPVAVTPAAVSPVQSTADKVEVIRGNKKTLE
jgi:pilus assembly protein CpaB